MFAFLLTISPLLEFIAVIIALVGMWFVASIKPEKQQFGFKLWLISNGIWVIYGVLTDNWLLVLQFFTFFIITFLGVTNRK